jgi:hypothetical protein
VIGFIIGADCACEPTGSGLRSFRFG